MGKALAILLALGAASTAGRAMAQGLYLDPGQSGIGVTAGVATNEDATTLSLAAGYSFEAFVDVGLALNRLSIDAPGDPSAIGVGPVVTVHALRQNESLPLSIAGTGNFQYLWFDEGSDVIDVSVWNLFLGGVGYRRFAITDTVSVTPALTLGWNHTNTTVEFAGNSDSDGDGTIVLQVAGNVAFRDGAGRIWAVNPFMQLDDDNATIGIFFGGVFPM